MSGAPWLRAMPTTHRLYNVPVSSFSLLCYCCSDSFTDSLQQSPRDSWSIILVTVSRHWSSVTSPFYCRFCITKPAQHSVPFTVQASQMVRHYYRSIAVGLSLLLDHCDILVSFLMAFDNCPITEFITITGLMTQQNHRQSVG